MLTILLVDDDDVDIEFVRRAFQRHQISYPLICVEDGRAALAILRGSPGVEPLRQPYLILLDLNMPRMNGHEFLQELRNDPDLKRSVVFVLTTSEQEYDKLAAYEAKVAGYILKQNVGQDFDHMLELLNSYQKIVCFPN